MKPALHPWIDETRIVLHRERWMALPRVFGMPGLLLLACIALAGGAFHAGFGWCIPASAVLALGGSYAITHSALLSVSKQWLHGWWGAAPIDPRVATRTLLIMTGIALAVALVLAAALLCLLAVFAPHPDYLPLALIALEASLFVGTMAAVVVTLGSHGVARAQRASVIREPLLALKWLNDPRLPHILDWQRRDALVRWRSGGNFILVGVVLAGVPDGVTGYTVVGVVLLSLSLIWLIVVMRACAEATADAMQLLGTTSLDARRARTAALRYPLIAAVSALIPASIGTALLGGSVVVLCGWFGCAAVLSAWPLFRIVKLTSRSGGSA